MTSATPAPPIQPTPGSGDNIASTKGLATGRVGLLGAVVIGISCIAPTYTLTSGLGPTISAVGEFVPAVLLLGFIPMLLVAFAYRELNNAVPDSGTSFTWATKAFGPWVGWMGGWGLITATILVLSNLAAVAVDFFYLFLAQIAGRPEIADLTRNLWINIPTTMVFIAIAAWVSYRGLDSTQKLQYVLVAVQIIAIVVFDIVAIVRAYKGGGFDFTPISVSWFNPLEIGNFSLIAAGISLSIFMFWGWDVTLTMNEETKDPEKTPGRAATITVLVIISLYVLTALAVITWAGTGDEGLGAGNPENQESIFAALSSLCWVRPPCLSTSRCSPVPSPRCSPRWWAPPVRCWRWAITRRCRRSFPRSAQSSARRLRPRLPPLLQRAVSTRSRASFLRTLCGTPFLPSV